MTHGGRLDGVGALVDQPTDPALDVLLREHLVSEYARAHKRLQRRQQLLQQAKYISAQVALCQQSAPVAVRWVGLPALGRDHLAGSEPDQRSPGFEKRSEIVR